MNRSITVSNSGQGLALVVHDGAHSHYIAHDGAVVVVTGGRIPDGVPVYRTEPEFAAAAVASIAGDVTNALDTLGAL